MARNYKRDSKGRFSSAGGGGKLGKSAKNEKARAKYKKSKENLKATNEVYGGNSPAAKSKGAKRAIGAAKSGMTRTTKGLQGGASRQGSFKEMSKSASHPMKRKAAAAANKKASANASRSAKAKAAAANYRESLSGARSRAAKQDYKKATSKARFERRVAAESGTKNSRKINAANKAVSAMQSARGRAKPAKKRRAAKK